MASQSEVQNNGSRSQIIKYTGLMPHMLNTNDMSGTVLVRYRTKGTEIGKEKEARDSMEDTSMPY